MAKVLIVYANGSSTPMGWYYCLPGEDEDIELNKAADAHRAQGHTYFIVEHDGDPGTMNHGNAMEYIAEQLG